MMIGESLQWITGKNLSEKEDESEALCVACCSTCRGSPIRWKANEGCRRRQWTDIDIDGQ